MTESERELVRQALDAIEMAARSATPTQLRSGEYKSAARHLRAKLRPDISRDPDLVNQLLAEAEDSRDEDDLQAAMHSGEWLGWGFEHVPVLDRLYSQGWHMFHEDIIFVLSDIRDSRALPTFLRAIESTPEYLRDDEFRALARKAFWGLGKLDTPEARAAIAGYLSSPDPMLQSFAQEQSGQRGS